MYVFPLKAMSKKSSQKPSEKADPSSRTNIKPTMLDLGIDDCVQI